MSGKKARVKAALGRMPVAAEAYQALLANGRKPAGGYRLDRLHAELPDWVDAGLAAKEAEPVLPPRRVLVMAYLPWWLEYAAAMSILLASSGCEVGIGFVPYRRWTEPVQAFDRRRQSRYINRILSSAKPLIHVHDLSGPTASSIPPDLATRLEALSRGDVQYTLQREDLEMAPKSETAALYELRLERNMAAAASALELFKEQGYDAALIPNGSILEFGAVYQAARWAGVKSVTYEFGEQRERMWLAQNAEVMRQDTTALWEARGRLELTRRERREVESMLGARRSGKQWAQFARRWQSAPSQGAHKVAERLSLDLSRPVALLCTNVVGDSLALNRQVFSEGMADWLALTARHFEDPAVGQLVVRVHPGEMLGAGHPSAEVVREALPEMPANVVVVGPDSEINTYDLIEMADLGLVYTSTVGLEMAMAGIPVVVAGETHYRAKGFTSDPTSKDEYFETVDRLLAAGGKDHLGEQQRELAAKYAYRFFFEYPFPFPWHLIGFWEDVEQHPVEAIVQRPAAYRSTMLALIGEPIDWSIGDD
ncbi:MAG: hypothetical protein BMS9Abin28_1553 [Anaerolineae bacterium]|nr:MAG: hypothetical protein BMS9Abin28_1553 [Anaerolineae bacterium]